MNKHRQYFTIKEAGYIAANYLTLTDREIGEVLGRNDKSIRNYRMRNDLKKPATFTIGQFPKGHKPWNTGKSVRLNPATEFKKGQLPKNTKQDGAISIRGNRKTGETYQYIRVGLKKWVLLHRQIWQQAYGEIPASHIVTFRNGDTLDCRLENLECISRAEGVRRNANRKKAGASLKAIWDKVKILEANGRKHRYGFRSKYCKQNKAA